MLVYKFGGASVRSAEGIKNIVQIVSGVKEDLFIVVSAMGKTTNALEEVMAAFMKADREPAIEKLNEIESYHQSIIKELFKDEILSFTRVFDSLASNTVSTEWLTSCERKNTIFPWLNYRIFSKKK